METRKVYISGGSTYIFSLPKKWVKKNNIKAGDSLVVTEQKGAILIEPDMSGQESLLKVIRISNFKSSRSLENFIIALYLAGYNTIQIKLDRKNNLGCRQVIRHVMEHLIGIEIAEDTDENMLLEIIVDHTRISTIQLLRRIYIINRSMFTDFIKVLQHQDIKLAEDIIVREKEIDRLHFLIIRQLKSAVKYPQIAESLEISQPQDCLGYRVVVKSLERISDHLEKISKNYIELTLNKGTTSPKLVNLLAKIIGMFDLSVTSVLDKNREKAEEVFIEHKEIKDLMDEISILAEPVSIEQAIMQKSIFDSINRIAEYTEDIAELTINMSVENS